MCHEEGEEGGEPMERGGREHEVGGDEAHVV